MYEDVEQHFGSELTQKVFGEQSAVYIISRIRDWKLTSPERCPLLATMIGQSPEVLFLFKHLKKWKPYHSLFYIGVFHMRDYFCGWYFKSQSDLQTLAVIPAFHRTKDERSCSIQLITDTASWNVRFPYSEFQKSKSSIRIGQNQFREQGLHLELYSSGLSASGSLQFGPFTPIQYDIMGPFRYVPFMECRHSVFSMRHSVTGNVNINGVSYVFRDDVGYLEGDRGRSFPKEYAWTQCSFPEGALMLSTADIPLGRYHFTGIIGIILWKGTEYRLATYLGAKAVKIQSGEIIVRQNSTQLTVRQLEQSAHHPLYAPTGGAMARTIHEHAACRVFYRFQKDGDTLFEFESPNAAFEYEYPY